MYLYIHRFYYPRSAMLPGSKLVTEYRCCKKRPTELETFLRAFWKLSQLVEKNQKNMEIVPGFAWAFILRIIFLSDNLIFCISVKAIFHSFPDLLLNHPQNPDLFDLSIINTSESSQLWILYNYF